MPIRRKVAPALTSLPAGRHVIDGLVYDVTRGGGRVSVAVSWPPRPPLREILDDIARNNAAILGNGTPRHRDQAWELAKALTHARNASGTELFVALIQLGQEIERTDLKGYRVPRARKGGQGRRKVNADDVRQFVARSNAPESSRVAVAARHFDVHRTTIERALKK